ncbi:glycosyltransferase [Flavobacterium sp. KACC 22761]|uniref:glycosyltransferase n=1 Tax=Flavobacterium sp. KACC 22761 TaxID=3092665 RepID=UPI002A75B8E0|nr:glycosyltransferase [Flavobacterium sp. KACC 22761]WPO79520.1 glycosyltransferase [Flavobacterium sp. KACC 22761]
MNKNKYQISIVVPFYNVELYFKQFLNSLLPINNNCEVILVDDGSKDSSLEIANEFVKDNNNVKLLRKENGGLSSARNYGLEFATGEYVFFFDSDDYIEDITVIYKMYDNAVEKKADILVAQFYEFIDLDEKKFRPDKINFKGDLISLEEKMDHLFQNKVSFAAWDKIYSINFLKHNNLKFKEGVWFEDMDFIYKAFFFANKISKIDDVLIGYRQRPGSIMKTISPKILDKVVILDGLYDFFEKNNKLNTFYEKYKVLYIRIIFSIIYSVLMFGRDKKHNREILDYIFNLSFFKTAINEKLLYKSYLSKLEKLLFYLVKFKILNRNNIYFIRHFAALRNL